MTGPAARISGRPRIPPFQGGKSVIRLNLGKILVNFLQVVKRRLISYYKRIGPLPLRKNSPTSYIITRVPTTKLANMSIDPKYVELTADVLEMFL